MVDIERGPLLDELDEDEALDDREDRVEEDDDPLEVSVSVVLLDSLASLALLVSLD